MRIAELLLKLIEKKYYENKEEISIKLDTFYAMNRITGEEYSNLTLKVEELYIVIEETVEENVEEIPVAEIKPVEESEAI